MRIPFSLRLVIGLIGLLAWTDREAAGYGGFGTNKVRYKSFKWEVLNSEHFEIYYYPGEEQLAYEMCETAEKAWQRQMEFFRFMKAPQVKVPIFLYATFHDFVQTNVTPEPLEEGVGGFTEVFKNRIVLPLSASKEQRTTVVTHELAHASQFFLLYGEGMKSYNLYKSVMIPLWFIEGSAEHVAENWDAMGEMVLRDSVLHDRVPPLKFLHHFNHLEPHDGYLGYKAGQSAVDLLVERYGEEKISAILKHVDQAKPFAQVFQEQIGISIEEFNKQWQFHLKETYWSQVKGKKDPSDYGPGLVVSGAGNTMINSGPSVSPTDDSIAFLSDRQGFRNVFLLKEGKNPRPLFRNGRFTSIFSSPPAWSPDGKSLAVVVKSADRSVILIVDPRNGRKRRELSFPLLDVTQPRFSPDGKQIAFVGFDGVAGEICTADVESGDWRVVTADAVANSSPVFSVEGDRVFYSSESGDSAFIKVVDLSVKGRPKSYFLGGNTKIKGSRPDISPDGKWLVFDSAESDIPNLYAVSIEGTDVRRITDVRTGIFGGRWTRDGRGVVAVVEEAGCQNIYKVKDALMTATGTSPALAPAGSEKQAPKNDGRKRGPGPALKDVPPSRLSPPRREFKGGSSIASRSKPGLVSGAAGAIASLISAPAWAGEPVRPGGSVKGQVARPAPLGLTAVLRDPVVLLSWSAGPIIDSVSRYEVYRSTHAGAGRLLSSVGAPGVTSYKDASWRYSENYYYRVRAIDSKGTVRGEGEVPFRADVEITESKYRLALESRLVDLFVFVGSVYVGAGTSFAGYGAMQISDLPGDNRFFVTANAIPGWTSLYGFSYEYSGFRPDIGLTVQIMNWSRFALVQSYLSTESFRYPPILTGIKSGAMQAAYPIDKYHRVEMAVGAEQFTEVFTDSTGLIETARKTSRLFPVSAAVVRDTSRWHRLLPCGGGKLRLGISQTVPLGSSALRLTEYTGEIQAFAGLLEDSALAIRWWGAVSQGHNRRYLFLGGRYSLRAHPVASQRGNGAILGNHEIRFNMLKHLNIEIPFLPVLFTDVQGIGFYDMGSGFDASQGLTAHDLRFGSIGAGLNFIGFVFQSTPVLFALEVARRIDEGQPNPTVYGRLGPLF